MALRPSRRVVVMRLSLGQVLRLAGVAVFTCAFWCCALLDGDGAAYPFLIACDLAILAILIIDLLLSRRGDDGLRLEGAARGAYLASAIVSGVLTFIAIIADVRVGAYDLSTWMLTVLICLPSDLAYPPRDAPSYDPPLPPQR